MKFSRKVSFLDHSAESPTPEPVRMSCAEVMQRGPWKRMTGNDLRWQWEGDSQLSLAELVGSEQPLKTFPSANPEESISLYLCTDGGVISYRRASGRWLHTLNTLSEFRRRVFELNLVPIAQLGEVLERNCDWLNAEGDVSEA